MRDIYLYPDVDVLRNKCGIKDGAELEKAEANYVSLRLREIAKTPLEGVYDAEHYLAFHKYIFQDLYDWAGKPRKVNITKSEPVLNGLSVEYSDVIWIRRELENACNELNRIDWHSLSIKEVAKELSRCLAAIWKVHPFREGNTRTSITFICQFADEKGFSINRKLFEENSSYVRTSLVAYNAFFNNGEDYSKTEYLEWIIEDALSSP